ncbi:MAG: imelysin family protein [Deltaproteobacteria bacterium]|nr:imelysin family protein [Deltaproteobacteria bacterium]
MLALCAALAACGNPLGDGDRLTTARQITADVIVPGFEAVVARTEALRVAIEALAAAPEQAALEAARAAWREARVAWKQTDAFRFGPAKKLSFSASIDQAIDQDRIVVVLMGAAPIDEAAIETLGANTKGFHAIELLVFGASTIADLTTDALAERRRELIVAYAQNLAKKARELRDAWTGGYAATFTEPGGANTEYPTAKSVIDALANEIWFQAEVIADNRMGKPMGTKTGGVPQPDLEESGPADNSIADMVSSLRGIRNVYLGGEAPGDKGLSKLVLSQSADTDAEVLAQLAAATAAVTAIPTPYRATLVDKRPEVPAAYAAVKELKVVLSTEVIGVLGATLKFNDNDGD